MRGRNRPKGPNPLTRSYESNGPDVKIRGTAQHIADKYAQLARDALAAGDPVAAENYFQHGEHYFRIVSGAQDQGRPANTGGYASRPYDDDMEEGDEEGQGNGGSQNGHAYNGYDDNDPGQQPQPYENRSDANQDGRQGRDRFPNRDQRRFDNNGRQDYRRQDQPRQDSRSDQSRYDNGRGEAPRSETRQEDRPASRPERAPRGEAVRQGEAAPRRERRREAAPVVEAEEPSGLPAFLMAPARPAPAAEPSTAPEPEVSAEEAPAAKPRRRRRPRFESAAEEGGATTPAADVPTE
jgi:hypothetical protein